MQPIHSISTALIDQLAHQLQREPTLGEIAFMLGKTSTSAQIYQVEELESKKEPEKRNNEIEKIIPKNTLWGDVHEELLCKIVPSVSLLIDEHMFDFTQKDALERSLTSVLYKGELDVLYKGELDGEKLIDSKEVDEMLEDKMLKSFEAIRLKQLHECYYSFLWRDGRKEHHSPRKDEGLEQSSRTSLMSLVGL